MKMHADRQPSAEPPEATPDEVAEYLRNQKAGGLGGMRGKLDPEAFEKEKSEPGHAPAPEDKTPQETPSPEAASDSSKEQASPKESSQGKKEQEPTPENREYAPFEPLPTDDPFRWDILFGVSKGASQAEIKKAFRRLSVKYHPDRHAGSPDESQFAEAFKLLAVAREIAENKDAKKGKSRDEDVRQEIAFKLKILNTKSFEELYAVLDEIGTIRGTHVYTATEVRDSIEEARRHLKSFDRKDFKGVTAARAYIDLFLTTMTSKYGLRMQVHLLFLRELNEWMRRPEEEPHGTLTAEQVAERMSRVHSNEELLDAFGEMGSVPISNGTYVSTRKMAEAARSMHTTLSYQSPEGIRQLAEALWNVYGERFTRVGGIREKVYELIMKFVTEREAQIPKKPRAEKGPEAPQPEASEPEKNKEPAPADANENEQANGSEGVPKQEEPPKESFGWGDWALYDDGVNYRTRAKNEAGSGVETLEEKNEKSRIGKVLSFGFAMQEAKNSGMARGLDWLYAHMTKTDVGPRDPDALAAFLENAANREKYLKDRAAREEKPAARFVGALVKEYRRALDKTRKNRATLEMGGNIGWREAALLASDIINTARATLGPLLGFTPWRSIPAAVAMIGTRTANIWKETHFGVSERLDEEAAYTEAMRVYERAKQISGPETPSARGLSSVFLEQMSEAALGRIASFQNGPVSRFSAEAGIRSLGEKLEKELSAIEANTKQSPQEKWRARETVLRKNQQLIVDLDRVVGAGGAIDVVGYNLSRAGVWSQRLSMFVAASSLGEVAYRLGHIGDSTEHFVTNPPSERVANVSNAASTGEGLGGVSNTPEELSDAPTKTPEAVAEAVVSIEKGGNIWKSAKMIAKAAGLDDAAFVKVWSESKVTLSDGREIPLSDLNLVHEGDTLSFVPGENGESGHFEFSNGSKLEFGDALTLPGATEGEPLATMDFENKEVPAEFFVPESDASTEEIVSPDTIANEVAAAETGVATEAPETAPETKIPSVAEQVNQAEFDARVERTVDLELRWFFGQRYAGSEIWKMVKDAGARTFVHADIPNTEENQAVISFQSYLADVGRRAGTRPRWGIFYPTETVEMYFTRVRRILEERDLERGQ